MDLWTRALASYTMVDILLTVYYCTTYCHSKLLLSESDKVTVVIVSDYYS